ncbi:MAG: SGNH/GDSL hydrolase family protein [Clostridia bacterium]|nr:SGNH/GDSL hydrolase family protein [Clostridia bacterium]
MEKDFFKKYSSATLAAGGTQTVYETEEKKLTGRVYNKLYVEGTFDFSFLYANVTDSTFADGKKSVRNMPVDAWELLGASVALSDGCDPETDKARRTPLSFDGKLSKSVAPGEIFATDPVKLTVKKGQYISVEISVSGRRLPCHKESVIPIYAIENGVWKPDPIIPVPAMTGCTRKVARRVCFWGDSITQGIGTPNNSYDHYSAKVSEFIDDGETAFWDIGLGFGRGNDAASCGVWMDKAKTNDVVCVCFGVNDINSGGMQADQITEDLKTITGELKKAGCKVLVQTVPPFNYSGARIDTWNEVNRFILGDPSLGADAVFDNVKILGDAAEPHKSLYNPHPNSEGSLKWAKALAPVLKELIEK